MSIFAPILLNKLLDARMVVFLEGGNLQRASGTTSKKLWAIVEMLLELFLIRKQLMAMRAGLMDFNTVSLEVINSVP